MDLFGGTTYHEDGSKTVRDGNIEYHYDKEGRLLSTTETIEENGIKTTKIIPTEYSALATGIVSENKATGEKVIINEESIKKYDKAGNLLFSEDFPKANGAKYAQPDYTPNIDI